MKIYICYGTFGGEHHACARAHTALREAGYEPEVVKTYGCYGTDRFFSGRREESDVRYTFHGTGDGRRRRYSACSSFRSSS